MPLPQGYTNSLVIFAAFGAATEVFLSLLSAGATARREGAACIPANDTRSVQRPRLALGLVAPLPVGDWLARLFCAHAVGWLHLSYFRQPSFSAVPSTLREE